MPAQTETRSGLMYGWGYGENGWNVGMDANMLRIGRFGFHLSVKARNLTEVPENPQQGDSYIVATGGEGDWTGHDGQVAVWVGSGWVYAIPRVGWLVYVENEEVLSVYKLGGWSVGIAI